MISLKNVVIFVLLEVVLCDTNVYRAAIVERGMDISRYMPSGPDAGEANLDIIVLPPIYTVTEDFQAGVQLYDQITNIMSETAKKTGVYVVTHLMEATHCQNKEERMRSSLVFDRRGDIAAVYKKPLSPASNCSSSEIPSFTTDFGVTFALMMEEDLVLQNPEDLMVKNLIVIGKYQAESTFLSGSELASSWAYASNANLLTADSIYLGKAGVKAKDRGVAIAELKKEGSTDKPAPLSSMKPTTFNEDLSQYSVKPLDLEASARGFKQTVCHGAFCCDFNVKTKVFGSKAKVSYGLAVFDGVRHFANTFISTQACSVVACAGLYKRSCVLGPNNSTDTIFEKLSISGNFAKSSTAFPIITSTDNQNVEFETETTKTTNKATINVANGKNLLKVGIFGRDYAKDFQDNSSKLNTTNEVEMETYYDYFANEDMQELFDYLWIRLRIPIFIVSIYVLEMM